MSSNQKEKASNSLDQKPRRRARPFLLTITVIYAAAVLGIPLTSPELLIHALLCYAPPLLLAIPLTISGIISLFLLTRRRFPKTQLLTLATIAITLPFLYTFEINPIRPEHGEPNLRVLTCNILFTTREVPELAEYIKKNNVDLIFLQENGGGSSSPANYLKHKFPNYHLFAEGSAAILSRWPLSETRATKQKSLPQRRILTAKVNAPVPFRAATMHWFVPQISRQLKHFEHSIPLQIQDCDQLLDILKDEQLPLVFGGDFNNPPRHGLTRKLREQYNNTFSTVGSGPGLTFSSETPLIRIDHLYTNEKITPITCSPGPSFRSDHFSLLADYEVLK